MQELKVLAETRYNFKLDDLSSIKSVADKLAFLRDLCLTVGITLNLNPSKLILEEDLDKLKDSIAK